MARANVKHGLTLGGVGPDLPNPGRNRMWRVEVIKNVDRNPIKVTLMERVLDGSLLYTPLAHRRTVAVPAKVVSTCDAILEDVSEYASIVGDYANEKRDAE